MKIDVIRRASERGLAVVRAAFGESRVDAIEIEIDNADRMQGIGAVPLGGSTVEFLQTMTYSSMTTSQG